jgi:hypothetical protein
MHLQWLGFNPDLKAFDLCTELQVLACLGFV